MEDADKARGLTFFALVELIGQRGMAEIAKTRQSRVSEVMAGRTRLTNENHRAMRKFFGKRYSVGDTAEEWFNRNDEHLHDLKLKDAREARAERAETPLDVAAAAEALGVAPATSATAAPGYINASEMEEDNG